MADAKLTLVIPKPDIDLTKRLCCALDALVPAPRVRQEQLDAALKAKATRTSDPSLFFQKKGSEYYGMVPFDSALLDGVFLFSVGSLLFGQCDAQWLSQWHDDHHRSQLSHMRSMSAKQLFFDESRSCGVLVELLLLRRVYGSTSSFATSILVQAWAAGFLRVCFTTSCSM